MRPDEILRARARALALATPVDAIHSGTQPIALVVAIGPQRYAFVSQHVRRAAVVPVVTPLPHTPPQVLGIGSCDGEVTVIFDARVWCGFEPRQGRTAIPVIIIGPPEASLALAVDELAGMTALGELDPPPARSQPWLRGITKDSILVVEAPKLLDDPTFWIGRVPAAGADDEHP